MSPFEGRSTRFRIFDDAAAAYAYRPTYTTFTTNSTTISNPFTAVTS